MSEANPGFPLLDPPPQAGEENTIQGLSATLL